MIMMYHFSKLLNLHTLRFLQRMPILISKMYGSQSHSRQRLTSRDLPSFRVRSAIILSAFKTKLQESWPQFTLSSTKAQGYSLVDKGCNPHTRHLLRRYTAGHVPQQYKKIGFLIKFYHLQSRDGIAKKNSINLLKTTGYVMHQQFNIQQLYVLPTLYLCVLYLSGNKQRLVPLTA